MRFEVITLFPELFESFLAKGLVAKAHEQGVIHVMAETIEGLPAPGVSDGQSHDYH